MNEKFEKIFDEIEGLHSVLEKKDFFEMFAKRFNVEISGTFSNNDIEEMLDNIREELKESVCCEINEKINDEFERFKKK